MFSDAVMQAARQHAISCYPQESCGVVIDNAYKPCENIAKDPVEAFEIHHNHYEAALAEGRLQAVIHSHHLGVHPNYPSYEDMIYQQAVQVPFGIVMTDGRKTGEFFFWGDGVPVAPYEGREFRHGVQDCYSLVADWLWQQRQARLPCYPRHDKWWKMQGHRLYEDQFAQRGFRQISFEEATLGDFFLAKIMSKTPNHAGIYMGNGLILHHLQDKISMRESGGRYRDFVSHWLRYVGP